MGRKSSLLYGEKDGEGITGCVEEAGEGLPWQETLPNEVHDCDEWVDEQW